MNIEAAYKEGPSRVYFLRRLGPFNACRTMQCMVHWCVVDSVKAVAEKRREKGRWLRRDGPR